MVMSAAGRSARSSKTHGVRRRFRMSGLIFVLYVVAEVFAFIGVGHAIGYGWAFLLLVAVSLVGGYLLRVEGPRAFTRLSASVYTDRSGVGRTKARRDVATHVLRLLGAILITLPGFVSAAAGILLFLPPVRALAGRAGTTFAANHLLTSSTAATVFGPRRVKVRTGRIVRDDTRGPDEPDGPIEGEIVDRR